MRPLRIGTRGSPLALTQTTTVARALEELGAQVEIVRVHTQGDVDPASLAQLGGVGVFAAALRLALLSGECDLAVHSFKDLPTAPVPGLTVAAVPPRADFADVVVCRDGLNLASLPAGAQVGTGSPRRAAAVLAARPDLQVVDIRGNVATRLGRVRGLENESERGGAGDLDAVVLARAGLQRLRSKWAQCATLPALPAPAQGALAIEARIDDREVLELLASLDDAASRVCAGAERAVLAGLQAGCAAPVGALATYHEGELCLRGQVLSTDGVRQVQCERRAVLVLPATSRSVGPTAQDGNPLVQDRPGCASEDAVPAATTAPATALPPGRVSSRADLDVFATDLGMSLAEDLLAAGAGEITNLQASRSPRERDRRWGGAGPEVSDRGRPLLGRTVFLPRPPGDHLAAALEQAGARVLAHPLTTTELVPPPGSGGINPVRAALREFAQGSYSWVFITSGRTISALAAHAAGVDYDDEADPAALAKLVRAATAAGTQFAVLGDASADRLEELGARMGVVVSGKATGARLAKEFLGRGGGPACQYYGRAWLPASALASPVLGAALSGAGWVVDRSAVYTTVTVRSVPESLRTAWDHGMVEAAAFTAGSNVRAAAQLLGALPSTTKLVAFGEPSAQVARECGYSVAAIAAEQTPAGLVEAVAHAFQVSEQGQS